MPTEKEVYDLHSDRYEQLVFREDYQQNIPKAIAAIRPYHDLDIIELGAGTGRLTRFLSQSARSLNTCDLSHHMLLRAAAILEPRQNRSLSLNVADMRRLPFPSDCADMAVAGWSFCYLAVWGGQDWQASLQSGLAEALRVLRPGGVVILLENYGTGFESPHPPPHLDAYFEYLKTSGFQSSWIRTDYRFESMAEAQRLSDFFFGSELAEKVSQNQWQILPEFTGVFWLEKQCNPGL